MHPGSHGQVATQCGLVPRVRRVVASDRSRIPVCRREITQPGGIVPVVRFVVTLIRGSPG